MNAARTKFEDEDLTGKTQPAAFGISAVLGVTERGPINNPSEIIASWPQYQSIFGGLLETSDFPLLCKRMLEGGSKLRINRVVHFTDVEDNTTATATKAAASGPIVNTVIGGTVTTAFTAVPKYAGAKYNELRVKIEAPTNGRAAGGYFNLRVYLTSEPNKAELYQNIVIEGRPTAGNSHYLDSVNASSNLAQFVYADLSAMAGNDNIMPKEQTISFSGAVNGDAIVVTDYIGNAEAKTGLYAFDAFDDFYQIFAPEISDDDLNNAGADYADTRGDCEYWAHLDNGLTTTAALIAERNAVTIDTKYISFFGGGLKVKHPTTNAEIEISELADIAAIQAYVDSVFGPWRSAANFVRGSVRNPASGVVNNFGGSGQYANLNLLANNQINMMVAANNKIYLAGNNSGQFANSKASFRNVVRLIIHIKKSLAPTLQKYLEEPMDFDTFRDLYKDVTPFLDDLSDRRAFEKTAEYAGYRWLGDQDASSYDELEINTKADMDLGKYKALLKISPTGSIVELTLVISLTDGALDIQIQD